MSLNFILTDFDHWRVDQDPGALVNMYDHEICITGGTYGASGVFDTERASGVFDTENDNVYFQRSRQSSRDVTGPGEFRRVGSQV